VTGPLRSIILDSEGLSRAAAHDPGLHVFLTAAARQGHRVIVPAVVLAEVVTGRPADARLWHIVNRLVVDDLTREVAAEAGALRERAQAVRAKKRDLTVDALVAATARRHAPSVVLTADTDDLELLCDGADVRVRHPHDVSL
jgi:predicted nucleic acid-binding protein